MKNPSTIGPSAVSDHTFSEWLAADARLQRFLSEVSTRAPAWAEPGELVSLGDLAPCFQDEVPTLCERYRRETRAMNRHRAPLEGSRSARMALWMEAGRMRGRHDAGPCAEEVSPPLRLLLGHGLASIGREWRTFGEYEVSSLVDVRHEAFRVGRACRYHYWRAYLGAWAVQWTSSARPQDVFRLQRALRRRIEQADNGLSAVFAEWLDEERDLREQGLEAEGLPEGEGLSALVTRLVCQDLRWRSIEEEIETRALWHASQRRDPERILVDLRLGRIGAWDPEFAGEDRGLLALATLGRLASLSETGHRILTASERSLPVRAAEA